MNVVLRGAPEHLLSTFLSLPVSACIFIYIYIFIIICFCTINSATTKLPGLCPRLVGEVRKVELYGTVFSAFVIWGMVNFSMGQTPSYRLLLNVFLFIFIYTSVIANQF